MPAVGINPSITPRLIRICDPSSVAMDMHRKSPSLSRAALALATQP